jgi:hypothetical protein
MQRGLEYGGWVMKQPVVVAHVELSKVLQSKREYVRDKAAMLSLLQTAPKGSRCVCTQCKPWGVEPSQLGGSLPPWSGQHWSGVRQQPWAGCWGMKCVSE